ncbi:MAG: hypothetical protein A2794_04460 [Alphaproteobacteria bacterium RIFCSPHIGHO2_01_FULL_40_8]|nr:MAG: hypothetical protein A2794_04460 [Alphaproteobacteria bacterium RIFCSPHIGHO2_01_FULL_40_8]
MDSLGRDGDIHPAVQRILSNITITDLASDGLKETDMFKTRLPEQMRQYQTQSCQTLACPRQEDGYSCGYHAVFNLARVHAAREVKAGETLAQDGVEVNAQRFIADRKRDLIQSFSSRVAAGFTQKSHNQLLEILNSTSAYHEKLESLPPLGIIDEQARRIYRKIIADFAESWYFQLNHDKEVPNKSAAMKFFDDLVRIRFDSKDDMPAVKEMVSEISQRPSDFLNNPAQILIPCQKQINQILAKQASSERHGSDRRDRKPFSGSDDRHKKRAGSRDEEKSERVRVDSGARYPKPKSPQHRKLYVELRQEPVAYQKPKSSDLMLEGYKVDDKKVMLHYRKKSDKSEVVEELPKGPQWKVDGDKVVVTEKYAKDIWKFYFHQKKGELPKSGRPAAMSEHDIEENHTSETLPPVVIKLISVKALNDNSRSH